MLGGGRQSGPQSRTALLGGTFDPIHRAHLEIARAAADRFALDQILFIPAASPPHKANAAIASYDDRVRMAELACAVDPRFVVSRIEEGSGPSYSILTIEKLKAQGIDHPAFLIGADAFREIRTWYRWPDVIAAVEFIVVTRPGADYSAPPGAKLQELTGLSLPTSSSAIRARLAAGDDCADELPASVLAYIYQRGLYGSQPQKIS
jgi:nicotinate-nucleotide adenylyltransferase